MSNNSDDIEVNNDHSNDFTTQPVGAYSVRSESLSNRNPATKSATTDYSDLSQTKQEINNQGGSTGIDGGNGSGGIFNTNGGRYAEIEKDSDSDDEEKEVKEYDDEVASLLSFDNNILLEEVTDGGIGLGHDFSKCICCSDKPELPYVRQKQKGGGRKFNSDDNYNDNDSIGSGIDDYSDYYDLKNQYNEEEIYNFFSSAFENLEINDDEDEEEEGHQEQTLQIEEIVEEEEQPQPQPQSQEHQNSSIDTSTLNQYEKEKPPLLSPPNQAEPTEEEKAQALQHLEQLELQDTLTSLIGEELGSELDNWYTNNYDAPSDLIALSSEEFQNIFNQQYFVEDLNYNSVGGITAADTAPGTIATPTESFASRQNLKQGEEVDTVLESAFNQLSLQNGQTPKQLLFQDDQHNLEVLRQQNLLSFVMPTDMFCQPCREEGDEDKTYQTQEDYLGINGNGGLGQDEERKWNADYYDSSAITTEEQNQDRSEFLSNNGTNQSFLGPDQYHQQQSRIDHNSSYNANVTSTNSKIRGKPDQIINEQQGRYRSVEEHQQLQQHRQRQRQNDDRYSSQQQQSQPQPQDPQSTLMNQRERSLQIADPIKKAFESSKKNERQCFGHKETIYGLSFSPCGTYCASASQDSTVCIWNVKKNSLVQTLKGHDKENECLRVVWSSLSWGGNSSEENPSLTLATGGADGIVCVWTRKKGQGEWVCVAKLDHTKLGKSDEVSKNQATVKSSAQENDDEENGKDDEDEVPQIYAIQFIDDWRGLPPIRSDENGGTVSKLSVLITSSDDFIHLWQLMSYKDDQIKLENMMDIKFTHLDQGYGGAFVHFHNNCRDNAESSTKTKLTSTSNIRSTKTAYGGDRNPDNLVFVFDASHCQANDLLGVALSDGTLRLVNGRGVCVSILQLPGCESHLTSFAWDMSGTKLASCVATGHVILWRLHFGDGCNVFPSCQAVLEGGHTERRPLYGAKFCGGEDQNLLLTWGVDGSLCLWDSYADGQIGAPLAVLLSNSSYPIYAVDVLESSRTRSNISNCIAVGGGREAGFLGMPLSLYNFGKLEADTTK
mmetsp:Transcript_22349/g.33453  ORF Transcript_22349/g.33453 Transcript_22349/m.33453 type:complete len:1059 (+) Transcript_22349:74-3250(+)